MVKTIIFDLDGVLVYTDKFHYLAWKKMADRIGVPFDETINNRLRGVSRMDSLEIILERSTRKYTQEEKEDLAEEKNGYYKEFLKKMSPADVRPEIRGMLKELHKRGYQLAIGSSSLIVYYCTKRNFRSRITGKLNISFFNIVATSC